MKLPSSLAYLSVPRGLYRERPVLYNAGCDTGFGLSLAHHLHSLGFTVFAGCLFADRLAAAVE
jgi:3-hydroxybutyrate dehydrogenase